jgi:CheY-like chemotaxis protein
MKSNRQRGRHQPKEVPVPATTPSALTVLIVDDDCNVRNLLALVLTGAGFPVRLAVDGAEAVVVYRQYRHEIALVLLDVIMPVQDGPATLAALLQLNPDVRCCFVSAASGHLTPADLLALGAVGFVQKPFKIQGLIDVVRSLARPASDAAAGLKAVPAEPTAALDAGESLESGTMCEGDPAGQTVDAGGQPAPWRAEPVHENSQGPHQSPPSTATVRPRSRIENL